jgi:hypothetical protein
VQPTGDVRLKRKLLSKLKPTAAEPTFMLRYAAAFARRYRASN